MEEAWHPTYRTVLERGDFCERSARDFGWMPSAEASPEPVGNRVGRKTAKALAEAEEQERLARLERLFPVACDGYDIIRRPPSAYRDLARKLADQSPEQDEGGALSLQEELLAALASDGVADASKKGEPVGVVPSAFSFSNGGSGKCLLKDFRKCALLVTPEGMRNALSERGGNADEITSLCWDPGDQRSYAFQYGDPGDGDNRVLGDATTNALAFVGLALHPSVPGKKGLATAGFSPKNDAWTWPLWTSPLSLPVLKSLLTSDARGHRRADVPQWRRSARISSNKRYYFLSSVPVTPDGGRGS
jgi:hypothetical protein